MVTLDDDVRPNVVMCVSVHCVVTEAPHRVRSWPGSESNCSGQPGLAGPAHHITSLGAAAGRAGHKLPSPRHWPPLAGAGAALDRGPGSDTRGHWPPGPAIMRAASGSSQGCLVIGK